jgi:hypothetical protein
MGEPTGVADRAAHSGLTRHAEPAGGPPLQRRLTASSCSFRLRENDAAKADFMPVFDEQINDITHPPSSAA